METETAAGLLFCRPRPAPRENESLSGPRVAIATIPIAGLFVALVLVAQRAGEAGDLATTVLAARAGFFAVVLLYVAALVVALPGYRARLLPKSGPLAATARVHSSFGGSFAQGVVSLEEGALTFHGDAFDFRLPQGVIPAHYTVKDFIGLNARGIKLPLPKGAGRAMLRITLEPRDRDALSAILRSLTPETEAVLPPLYRDRTAVSIKGGWVIVLLFAAVTSVAALVQRHPDRLLTFALIGAMMGWIIGPGSVLIDRQSRNSGERAFRKLQSLDPKP